jgi:transposase
MQVLEAGTATQPEIVARFQVSPSFVAKPWQRWRRSGSCAAIPHTGGTPHHLKGHTETLRQEVAKQPDTTLEALRDRVVAAHGPRVSLATICRELHRLRLPHKKSHSTPRSVSR